MRKISLLLFIVCFLFNSNNIFAEQFSDIKNSHRNYDAIEYVKEKWIVSGYPNGDFRAKNQVNRAEYLKMIIWSQFHHDEIDNCLTTEEENLEHPFFNDINKWEWYVKYVCIAVKEWLIEGYPDWSFRPINKVILPEVAKILISINQPDFKSNNNFWDEWFKGYVKELANEKKAVPWTVLNYDYSINRGEIAEILYRLNNDILDKESPSFENLHCQNWDIYINSWATVWDICTNRWDIYIDSFSEINWNITTIEWNINIWSYSKINWDIKIIEDWKIEVWNFVYVKWSIKIENWDFRTNKSLDVSENIEALQWNIVLSSNFAIWWSVIANRWSIRAEDYSSVQWDTIALKDIILWDFFNTKNVQSFSWNIEIWKSSSIYESIIANLWTINIDSFVTAKNIKANWDIFLWNELTIKEDIVSTWWKVDSWENLDVNKLYSKRWAYIWRNSNIWTIYWKIKKKSTRVNIKSFKDIKAYTWNLEMENVDKNVQNHSK